MKPLAVITDFPEGDGDLNDCTVRALATAAQVPYLVAHVALSRAGRRFRDGCTRRVWEPVYNRFGLHDRPLDSRMQVCTLLKQFPEGRFVVRVKKHVFAVVDGVVYDDRIPKLKQIVKNVYAKIV